MTKKETALLRQGFAPNQVRAYDIQNRQGVNLSDLSRLGIGMDSAPMSELKRMFSGSAMDAAPALQTTATIPGPIQFFQYWVPKAVDVITAARAIDDLVGRDIEGSFEDEEIVTRILEKTGKAEPYTDTTNIPFASYNPNYEKRNVVRFELGLHTGYLEDMRASRSMINDHDVKAQAVAESMAITLNDVGFYGYAAGDNKTYGFLNEPALSAYETVAIGAVDTTWATKTFEQITADIKTAVAALQNKLGGLFKPNKEAFTIAISLQCEQYLYTMNAYSSKSVAEWIKDTYPAARVEAAFELNGANGGSNVMYVYADTVNSNKVFKQSIQDAFRLVGIEKHAKGTIEDYACATAGVICQYPVAVVRYSGI